MKLFSLPLVLFACFAVQAQPGPGPVNQSTARFRRLASEPATCVAGDVYHNLATHKDRQCLTTNTWSDFGTGSASADATYITQTPNASLSNEQALNALVDGLLKHSSGVVARAIPGTDYIATESDPVVKAINGIVKSNGSTIAAAVAGTDYESPLIFTASDFDRAVNTISVDYTNGQTATGAQKGFLIAADWTTFNNKQAALGFTPENSANKDATGGYAGLTLFKINFKNAANTFTSFFQNTNSAARTYTFQNRDGTIADDTDLTGKQNTITFGTGVLTALGVNIGSAGAPVLFNGAGGTPSSIALINGTGLPATGGGTGQSTYTKGDILASPGSNTLNKLTVGTDGQVLTADAASTNGVKWAAAGGGGANTVTTSVLLSSTSVNLNEGTGAKQTLYTCPASRRCVVTNVVFQKPSTSALAAVYEVGWDAGADDVVGQIDSSNFLSITPASSLNGATNTAGANIMVAQPAIGTAASVLGLKVSTPEGSALTAIVDVYGYLTDTSGVPVANVNGTGDAAAIAPASVTTTNGIGIGVAAPSAGLSLDKTITAGGTTGAQTINKASGSVNFAAAATSLVVTNSLVTTSSVIQCTVATNDATMKSVQCVAGSGSFTIFASAAATAETRVSFTVFN